MLETGLTSCRASVSGTQSRHPGVLKLVTALIIIISLVYSSESRRVCFIRFIQKQTPPARAGPTRSSTGYSGVVNFLPPAGERAAGLRTERYVL